MSEFYPSSSSEDAENLTKTTVAKSTGNLTKSEYIISQLRVKKCEGGCGVEFYFKYHDSDWYQYQKDNVICSYPPDVCMAINEDQVICQKCDELGDYSCEAELDMKSRL